MSASTFLLIFIHLNSENGQLSGEVLVYRYPGLHFGDVHVLTATPIPNLEKNIVGFSKYVILFPISGPRPLADEMAGGDYDGDMFFVSRNPQVGLFILALYSQLFILQPHQDPLPSHHVLK